MESLSDITLYRTSEETVQSRCSFKPEESDKTLSGDQLIALGSNWFYTKEGILNKAEKTSSGAWNWQDKNQDNLFQSNTMLVMEKKLYIRHEAAPDQPFLEVDPETLRVKE